MSGSDDFDIASSFSTTTGAESGDKYEVIAKQGKDEVIVSSSIIFLSNITAEIYPFADDRTYAVRVKVEIDHNQKNATAEKESTDESYNITIKRSFSTYASAHVNIRIAEDESFYFLMNMFVTLVGNVDKFAAKIDYVISRRLIP